MTLLLFTQISLSQTLPTDYFRSRASGNWNSYSVWESSHDNINWSNATMYPDTTSSGILISTGTSINISASIRIDQVKIMSGGTLKNSYIFNLDRGPGIDMDVYGILELNDYMATSAEVIIRDGAQYIKYLSNNRQINRCTWENGSTLKLITFPSTNLITVSALDQHFYNMIIDGTNQKYPLNLQFTAGTQISGNFTILTSNYMEVRLTSSSNPLSLMILGNLSINSNCTLILNTTATPTSLSVYGNVSIGSSCELSINNLQNNLILFGNLTLTSGAQINKSPHQNGTIIFAGLNEYQTVSNSGLINNVNYKLNSNAIVTFNTISLSSSAYNLTIEDNASLIIPNTGINAIVKKQIPPADWSQSMNGWHLLSSPVQNQSLLNGGFTTGPYDFFKWSEIENLWLNQKESGNDITAFIPGQGYLVSYDDGGTKTFTGNLNSSSINFTNLSYTGSSPAAGYQLLGNPFPCSLDWNATGWNRMGFSNIAQVWSDIAGNYLPLTEDNGIIPPEQGFFVQALSGINSITIPTIARVHSNTAFHKQIPANFLRLRISDTVSGQFDETVIMLAEAALEGYDAFDGYKMNGSESAPQLYTSVESGERVCVNGLPVVSTPSAIGLYFKPGTAMHYILKPITNTFLKEIWLEDKLNGTFIPIDGSELTVESSPDFPENRFMIHLGSLGLNEGQTQDEGSVYSYGKTIYFSDKVNASDYKLFNLTGKLVKFGNIQHGVHNTIDCSSLTPGVYFVKLTDKNRIVTRKIIIY